MKTLVLYNPVAAGGRSMRVLEKVRAFLNKEGFAHELKCTPESIKDPVPDWKYYSSALLVGGDGSLHRLLNTWGVPPIPLCLISGGSGNDFSRLSHGTASLEEQLAHFKAGNKAQVDLGKCNGTWFATGVGIGFDGKVAEILRKNSRWKGHLAYMLVVIRQIFVYRETHLSIRAGAHSIEGKSLMLTIGNGSEFGGGFRVTPKATFFDGIFHCCRIRETTLLQRIAHLPKVEKGKHEQLPFVEMFEASELSVNAEQPLPCHMDGEVYQWKSFEIEMFPGALCLLVGV